MSDPSNLLPSDPVWNRRVDAMTKLAAQELKCAVVLVAIQENGKLGASVEGGPKSGPLRELLDDPQRLFGALALAVVKQEETAGLMPMQ